MLINQREIETLIIITSEPFVQLKHSEIIDGINKELFDLKEDFLILNGSYVICKETRLSAKIGDYSVWQQQNTSNIFNRL